ncbi:DUF4158 domain-containing protein [Francisella noatunensis]|uniref:DUF4158 domain-containing protein n=1 Tax=Francisella noatunensis TaxID=657445 RepID=A0A9Q2QI46_9GAMM|nr:DUF4158 domain-containing protein [Francisella noatunensis]MBK2028420.1 DUF4158 domain-containing protein [Francisella noatunensis]MBK2034090.1 DUF4158 domain-containing protein [Francisella noatunensis]MBK2050787.1 DUF4158 domain-containing protein [Francisella noatunensis]MBK2052287.1 DUF4158 domain-containing protein [Francisella noatunensis]MBK2053777.1 DUF4158 domain-containing protein [Francisella noatunensis]
MSQFQVLPEYDAQQFDKPPKFNNQERISFFIMDKILDHVFVRNSNPDARVGAILQLGYFKATNKFYNINSYYKQDIRYISDLLNVDYKTINLLRNYPSTSKSNHKRLILEGLGFESFYKHKDLFDETIKNFVANQMLPRKIIYSVIDIFNEKKIETPSYDAFCKSITKHFRDFESSNIEQLDKILTKNLFLC